MRKTDAHVIVHGYVTGISGAGEGLRPTWVFFEDLEPALVFGRAARMGFEVSAYGVHRAAREVRWLSDQRRQVTTVHVLGPTLDRLADEAEHFQRWVRAVDPDSSHYSPPEKRRPRPRQSAEAAAVRRAPAPTTPAA